MAHFYGTVRGSRGEASRQGGRESGITTHCASWSGAVRCHAYVDEESGDDWVRVELTPWHGRGVARTRTLYQGPIGTYSPMTDNEPPPSQW